MALIDNLNWRYATKKFDSTKKVSQEDIEKLMEATRLSASSYGFQPYKILNIEDKALREKLQPASWGQSQIIDASHMFVFCHYKDLTDDMIDEYMALKSKIQNIPLENLKGYGDFVKGKTAEMDATFINWWNARQAYIAVGTLLAACAELQIDSCPMEGFAPEEYDKILGLSEKGLQAVTVVTIGYRSAEDETQNAPKVRKATEVLFETI